MIVFSLKTWSPNQEKWTTRWGAAMWTKRNRDQNHKTRLELLSATGEGAEEVMAARHALMDHQLVQVTLTRFAPSKRGLDDDNLPKSLKHVRDGVAFALGVLDDADPRYRWIYKHEQTRPTIFKVGITLTPVISLEIAT